MPNNRSNKPRLQPRGKGNSNPDNWARGWEIGVFYDCAKRGVDYETLTTVLPNSSIPESSYAMHVNTAKKFAELSERAISAGHSPEQVSAAEEHYLNAAVRTTTHRMRDNSEITDAFASQGIVF
jgi:hypothetical protein